MTYAGAERAALSDLLDDLGPDAPTLCEGWTTADLAAHIVLREHRPDAAGGIVIKPLAGYTRSVQDKIKKGRAWPALVGSVRQGPPRWSPYRLPVLESLVNHLELFVHHEDVRRAQPGWEPRELPAGQEEDIWKRVSGGARLMLRRSPVGIVLRHTDGRTAGAVSGTGPRVTVTGDPAELLMFAFGRQDHARVAYEGDETSIAKARSATLGL
ncbi:TIGR03085 family metal-binding protein [Sphaerisporangium aureirubrum]|uniref:TIGR03085 family metal-binding protein n=1 Tax=Sphaerisporangium aureirubrum TaxID=1544736 RepID=A0ABW1NUF3_9ACTN